MSVINNKSRLMHMMHNAEKGPDAKCNSKDPYDYHGVSVLSDQGLVSSLTYSTVSLQNHIVGNLVLIISALLKCF